MKFIEPTGQTSIGSGYQVNRGGGSGGRIKLVYYILDISGSHSEAAGSGGTRGPNGGNDGNAGSSGSYHACNLSNYAPLGELVSGTGSVTGDKFGWSVSYAGDVNDDSYEDIIVGAPYISVRETGSLKIFKTL